MDPSVTTDLQTPVPDRRVAVGNNTELAVITAYLLLCLVAVLLGNGIIIVSVFKTRALHTPHYLLLCSYAICDVATAVTGYPTFIVVLFYAVETPEWVCRFSCLIAAAFFCTVYMLGILAYERYHFFCHPLSYPRLFTTAKLCCLVAGVWLITVCYFVSSEIIFGRELFIAVMSCQMKSSIMTQSQLIYFFGPSLFSIIFSTVRVGMLWAKMRTTVSPQPLGVTDQTSVEALSNTYKVKIRKAGTAIKLILLISGLFWGTYILSFIARVVVLRNFTWDEIDTRQNMTAMILVRGSQLLAGTVSQIFNPGLYMYTHPQLRAALLRMLCPSRHSSDMTSSHITSRNSNRY